MQSRVPKYHHDKTGIVIKHSFHSEISVNFCVNVQLKNKSKYSVAYLMGNLDRYPSNVSH